MIRRTCSVAVALLLILIAPLLVEAQRAQDVPSLAYESLNGKDSFAAYCASCHGAGGHGDGPLSSALRSRPADLTMLARRNHDVFPRDRVRADLSGVGRTVAAHGPTEMPIWGALFRVFEPDPRVRMRIENLVNYLETIQTPPAGRIEARPALFRGFSSHGDDREAFKAASAVLNDG